MKSKPSLKFYIRQFRESKYYWISLYTLYILVGLGLCLGVVVPLAQTLADTNNQIAGVTSQIATLNTNIKYINVQNDATLSNESQLAGLAVPVEKDFMNTMQAILASAIQSNVNLQDFSLAVGATGKKVTIDDSPYTVDLIISGAPSDAARFIANMKQKLPLFSAQAVSINGTEVKFTFQIAAASYKQSKTDFSQQKLFIPAKAQTLFPEFNNWQSQGAIANIGIATKSGNLPTF